MYGNIKKRLFLLKTVTDFSENIWCLHITECYQMTGIITYSLDQMIFATNSLMSVFIVNIHNFSFSASYTSVPKDITKFETYNEHKVCQEGGKKWTLDNINDTATIEIKETFEVRK